jgi:ribonuclease J
MILELAQKHKRVVSVVGRSMLNVIAHARNLGYIKCPDNLLQPLQAIRQLPDENVLILTTGSQGELMSAMTRISRGEHPHLKIRPGDTVVFSANPIPGNTIAVVNTIDRLMMQGAKVVYGREQGIHVSGHGCQEDQKLMIGLTRPKFFLPVHGEHRMLVKHSQTAQSMGIPAENMVVIQNGDVVEVSQDAIRVAGKVPSGIELVDTSGCGIVSGQVLQERQQMASDGLITIAVAIDWNGKLLTRPEIHLRGVVTTIERSFLQKWVQERIEEILNVRWSEFAQSFDGQIEVDWAGLQGQLERELQRSIRRELQSQPTLTLLMTTPEEPAKVADGRRRRRSTAAAQVAS